MEVAKRHQGQLERIKKSVRETQEYFQPNYDRYNEFRRFVFESSLRDEEITLLQSMSKPQLEFNILEAYISRLLGEFSKQEPDIEVSSDDQDNVDPMVIKVVEQHLRHTLTDAKNHNTKYEVYKDLLSGGFSVLKVLNEYASPMSMKQVINIERGFDPTMCGFDILARYAHKGDGRHCFELSAISKEDFEEENPHVDIRKVSFRKEFAGFNWSYSGSNNSKILIRAHYYEKKNKKIQIAETSDGKVVKMDDYKKMLDEWGSFQAPPSIVGEPRWTQIPSICRYDVIENQVLGYKDTDFTMLPLIFVDGNSVMLKTQKNGNIRQFTRPYVYHAKGAQRLKNYAGIALANEVESIVQHKFIIKKEALPKEEELLQAIKDIQKPSNIIVNAFFEQNPDQAIPEPIREIIKMPAPPEVLQSFTTTDALIQQVLGSYDASLGINNNQLSGIAVVESASQSNAAAMPYIVGYLQGYNRAAEIYVDLLPKYYTTPRTIPVMDEDGKKGFVKINQEEGFDINYDSNSLNVIVKAGASFAVQKSKTIMMVKEMMGMSPLFAQFIAEKGLNFVLDNMEGKGIDQLKKMVDGWVQEMQQQKQMAMQQQQEEAKNNPARMKLELDTKKLQFEAMKADKQFQIDMMKLDMQEKEMQLSYAKHHEQNQVQNLKSEVEMYGKAIDLELKHKDMKHRHTKEKYETYHKITQPPKHQSHGATNGS